MKKYILLAAAASILAFALIKAVKYVRHWLIVRKVKEKWSDLQKFCASRETWPLAIITADKLLDEALKNKKFKGKSMGERLVSGQRIFSDNDGLWFSHNLAKKLMDETAVRLRQADVKRSLLGVRQALRDIGVLE